MEKEYKIIFIGGVPGVGKTSIAGVVAKKLGINIMLSGDYLREFVRPIASGNGTEKILSVSVYEAWKEFGNKDNGTIIKGYLSQCDYLSAGTEAVLKRAVKNGESLILESLYLNQGLVDIIKNNEICAAYLYINDLQTHAKRLNERQFYTHFKSPGERLSAQLDVYKVIMDYSVRLAKDNGLRVFDNADFKKTEKAVVDFVGNFYGTGQK